MDRHAQQENSFSRFIRRFLQFVRNFLVIFLVLSSAASVFLYIQYKQNWRDPTRFLPKNFSIYSKIPSLIEAYDNKSVEILLAQLDLKAARSTLLQIRSYSEKSMGMLKKILQLQSHLYLEQENAAAVLAAVDLKYLYPLSYLLKLGYNYRLGRYLLRSQTEKLGLTVLDPTVFLPDSGEISDALLFSYRHKQGDIYILLQKNVLLLADSEKSLERSLLAYHSGENLHSRRGELQGLERQTRKARSKSTLTLYIDIQQFLAQFSRHNRNEFLRHLLSQIEFTPLASLTLSLQNDSLRLDAYSNWLSRSKSLSTFLSNKHKGDHILGQLPQKDTILYSSLSFRSIDNLLQIMRDRSSKKTDQRLELGESLLQLALGLDLKQISSWIGSNVGSFILAGNLAPSYFIELGNEKAFDRFITKLQNSLFFRKNATIDVSGQIIHKVSGSGLVQLFGYDLEYFYAKWQDMLLISQDASELARLLQGLESRKTDGQKQQLQDYPDFQSLAEEIPRSYKVLLFYNDDISKLPFIRQNPILASLLSHYGMGLINLEANDKFLHLQLNARSSRNSRERIRLAPGYPTRLKAPIQRQRNFALWDGLKPAGLVYTSSSSENGCQLIISDIAGAVRAARKLDACAQILQVPALPRRIFALSDEGTIYGLDDELQNLPNFPIQTKRKFNARNPALFAILDRRMVLYLPNSGAQEAWHFLLLDLQNGEQQNLNRLMIAGQLRTPPSLWYKDSRRYNDLADGLLLAFQSKSFPARLHIIDLAQLQSSEEPASESTAIPLENQSYVPLQIYGRHNKDQQILQVGANGQLQRWNISGEFFDDLALYGKYYSPPLLYRAGQQGNTYAYLLSSQGQITAIELGKSIDQASVPLAVYSSPHQSGRQLRLKLGPSLHGDNEKFLYLYGAGNQVEAIDLQTRPRLALPGWYEPQFVDINSDQRPDMINITLEGDLVIYIYQP